jgi:hypothetical protein
MLNDANLSPSHIITVLSCLQERFLREQEFLVKERTKEKDARAAAYQKEQDRIRKAEEARMETERIHEAQQRAVEARKRDMAARDSQREAKEAEKQHVMVKCSPKCLSWDAGLKSIDKSATHLLYILSLSFIHTSATIVALVNFRHQIWITEATSRLFLLALNPHLIIHDTQRTMVKVMHAYIEHCLESLI